VFSASLAGSGIMGHVMRTGYIAAGLAVVLVLAAWISFCVVRDRSMRENFVTVSDGMAQDQVIRIMGPPANIEDCRGPFAPHCLDECAQAYVYRSAWAPLNPEYPVVFFDEHMTVIGKFDFSSP
jgi:hypothetical protein